LNQDDTAVVVDWLTETAMMHWNGDSSWWAWLAITLMMLTFWTVVGVAIWAVFRHLSPNSSAPSISPTTTADEILRQRYARGELDDEELRHRLETLRGHAIAE
jgi:putative membrane protein